MSEKSRDLTLNGIMELAGARKIIDALLELNRSGHPGWLIIDPENWASLQSIPQIPFHVVEGKES